MFYQDPFLLYQSPPYCHSSSPTRSSSHRPSFRIDDILVSRRQPFLVTKQPSFQEPRPPPMSNANPLKFGVHSILTQRPREDIGMLQGGLAVDTWFRTLKFYYKPIFLKNFLLWVVLSFFFNCSAFKQFYHLAQPYPLPFTCLKFLRTFILLPFDKFLLPEPDYNVDEWAVNKSWKTSKKCCILFLLFLNHNSVLQEGSFPFSFLGRGEKQVFSSGCQLKWQL